MHCFFLHWVIWLLTAMLFALTPARTNCRTPTSQFVTSARTLWGTVCSNGSLRSCSSPCMHVSSLTQRQSLFDCHRLWSELVACFGPKRRKQMILLFPPWTFWVLRTSASVHSEPGCHGKKSRRGYIRKDREDKFWRRSHQEGGDAYKKIKDSGICMNHTIPTRKESSKTIVLWVIFFNMPEIDIPGGTILSSKAPNSCKPCAPVSTN